MDNTILSPRSPSPPCPTSSGTPVPRSRSPPPCFVSSPRTTVLVRPRSPPPRPRTTVLKRPRSPPPCPPRTRTPDSPPQKRSRSPPPSRGSRTISTQTEDCPLSPPPPTPTNCQFNIGYHTKCSVCGVTLLMHKKFVCSTLIILEKE